MRQYRFEYYGCGRGRKIFWEGEAESEEEAKMKAIAMVGELPPVYFLWDVTPSKHRRAKKARP